MNKTELTSLLSTDLTVNDVKNYAGKLTFDASGNYVYPEPRSARNNLKRTLLRELLKKYKPDDPIIQKINEMIP